MILVTGSTGLVGRRVAAELRARGHPVRCLVHTLARGSVLGESGAELCTGDVLDVPSLARALRGVEAVIHLVAIIREKGSPTFQQVNHEGTRNVVEAARAAGVRRLVYVSALGAADNPRFRFLYSKWQAEREVIQRGVEFTILRPSLLFGEGDEFFNTLAGVVKVLPVIPVIGHGQTSFQPLAAEDLARCVAVSLERSELVNQVVEMGGPEQFTYNQLLDLVQETLGVRRLKARVPLPLMRPLIRGMGWVLPRPPVTVQQLELLNVNSVTGFDNVERRFGFKPRSPRGNISYVRKLSYWDALRTTFGFIPRHIRDH